MVKKEKRNINYFKKGVQDNASEIVIRENKLLMLKVTIRLIRRERGKLGRYIDELNVNSQKYNSDGGIMSGFREHFATLAEQSDIV